jgi:hypothetical protein
MAFSKPIGREGGEFLANSIVAGEQSRPKVVKLASGGFTSHGGRRTGRNPWEVAGSACDLAPAY